MSKTCYVNEQSFRMENKIIVQFELIIHSYFFPFSFFTDLDFLFYLKKIYINRINTYAKQRNKIVIIFKHFYYKIIDNSN